MKRNLRNKGGFTIMETIVAMVVVVIVSVAAATAVLSGLKAQNNIERDFDALRCAENILECFKATEETELFDFQNALVSAIRFAEGHTTIHRVDGKIAVVQNGYVVKIKYETTRAIEVSVIVPNGNEFKMDNFDDENDEEIVAFTYTKGGASS